MDAGLPENSVFAVRQTQEGYLWIGTQNGLVRFDGIDFKVFTRDKIPQLKDNEVRALYQDGNGTLWIGTTSGGLTLFKEEEIKWDRQMYHTHIFFAPLRVSSRLIFMVVAHEAAATPGDV